MTSDAVQQKIDEHNQHAIRRLVELLRGNAVIPFVGAGMSVPLGFKQWAAFLLDQAVLAQVEHDVKDLLNRGLYEEAAELLMTRLDQGAFQQAMEDEFGDHKLPGAPVNGSIALLPRLPGRIVITTNFDHVLEWAFEKAVPGERLKIIHGAWTQAVTMAFNRPQPNPEAFNRSSKVLIKIHGDVEDRKDRVLTKSEYDRSYGPANPENVASTQLNEVMRILLAKPLLFLGCSLERDRIVAMLKRLFKDLDGGLSHFAIVAAPADKEAFVERRADLGRMGIRPIWYPDGKFAEIERLLSQIVEQLNASQPVNRPSAVAPAVLPDSALDDRYWDGMSRLRARRYDEALTLFREVAAASPDYKQVRARIAEAESELERIRVGDEASAAESASEWDKAVAALEHLVRLSPGDAAISARLAHARTQVQLDILWEEAGEMYRRKQWAAVVHCFAEMAQLDPGVRDRNDWLADATRELQEEETRRLVKVHMREGIEHYEAQDWGKALSALHRVLELDPAHETARTLRNEVQSRVAAAEAAALLAERYRKATRAVDAKDWEDAVELLNAVIREDPSYGDAAALLEKAASEYADASAQFELKLTAKPSPAPPDSDVTWTLKIRNAGRIALSNVTVTEHGGPADGTRPSQASFDLSAGESKTLSFKSHHTSRGVRRHIEVAGTTPNGRSVRADVKTSVNIVSPAKEPVTPANQPAARAVQATQPAAIAKLVPAPVVPAPPPSVRSPAAPATAAFREAVREAKDKTDLNDRRSHELIYLLEQGERHYRVAVKALNAPRDWDVQVAAWEQQVAALKLDKVQFVSLALPGPDAILQKMERLAREIEERIGVVVPIRGLKSLDARID
jgi:tetratricopeptide (TPR) repeat protein